MIQIQKIWAHLDKKITELEHILFVPVDISEIHKF